MSCSNRRRDAALACALIAGWILGAATAGAQPADAALAVDPPDAQPADARGLDAPAPDTELRDAPPLDARGLGAPPQEAAVRNAGLSDAGLRDAGLLDAGLRDAGLLDAGLRDAGLRDAGLRDAGLRDAGALDAGVSAAGPSDAMLDTGALDVAARDAGGRDAGGRDAGAAAPTPPPDPRAATLATLFAIKLIAGLVGLLVLAYLGGNRRVVRFQERLGVHGVITAGFPFVALGLFASQPSVAILTPDVIDRLRPVLHFGLGWLGFIIGAQLDIRVLDRVPKGTAYLILVEALGPFGLTAAACGALMVGFGLSWHDHDVWRDVILLGAAAAMTAPRKFRGFANRTWHEGRGVDVLLGQLDELVGVLGLLFITAYFRDTTAGTWQLPGTAWVFVSLGLGVAIGVLIFAMVRVPVSNAEFLAVVLGAIAFASGLAGYLHLSPIVICFLAGVLVTNFPNDQRDSIFRILRHLERPVQLLFLIIAGAVWQVQDWRGWALVPLFVAGRALGKYTGVIASKTAVGALLPAGFADRRQLVAPLSGLSIALVVSVQSSSADAGLSWVVTAVIGGAIATELLIRERAEDAPAAPPEPAPLHDDRPPPAPSAQAAPPGASPGAGIDELDDDGGAP